ncbi:ferredoxin reductase [Streptantibioticus cattleyicolor NRRL 8057 = DSM 46488]|uniref:Ferredoxin reductase n=2 Tax=Streptantibioticus cattleyicolor TaxID=29303 RepID=G8WRM1_STREN|nr:FAD-dependent oxidoreductase [Streptantibioticus cattleyicolor]AEW93598.1 ferredoxin reductase [Streptantibioticus cattleyicolor NRRL 8057 = DSM 46488]
MSEDETVVTEDGNVARVVVAGAGMAGVQTAICLRDQGFPGEIILLGAEPHQPYDRPPLSKAVLLGAADGSAFEVDFAGLRVDLRLGSRAEALRPAEREVITSDGPLPYDRLVIATGAEPVTLPGSAGLPGVHLLRTLDDANALRPVLAARHEVVVVGAGWIGAEFATAARESGCPVTVVEAADHPLAGVLPPEIAEPMRGWYEAAGARLLTGTAVAAVEPGSVVLSDGTRLTAGAVVVGIGAHPATGWLAGSGIALDEHHAVRADDRLRTSLPGIYAVGDCASFPSARYGERLLIHHWDNAVQGPRVAAANLLGGDEVYDPVPYFWSEQFGRFVQYAGHHTAADRMVLRGEPGGPAWSVCWLRDGALAALLAVGRPRDLAQGRKLIERGALLDETAVRDAAVPLKNAVREAA